jgi:hypothetical protein
MPLRAKSAFQLVDPEKSGEIPDTYIDLLEQLLRNDPSTLALQQDWICERETIEIEKNLQHRDEGKQYGGALSLIRMPKHQQIDAIEQIQSKHWSDYGANYLLTSIIGLQKNPRTQQSRSDSTGRNTAAVDEVEGCSSLGLPKS